MKKHKKEIGFRLQLTEEALAHFEGQSHKTRFLEELIEASAAGVDRLQEMLKQVDQQKAQAFDLIMELLKKQPKEEESAESPGIEQTFDRESAYREAIMGCIRQEKQLIEMIDLYFPSYKREMEIKEPTEKPKRNTKPRIDSQIEDPDALNIYKDLLALYERSVDGKTDKKPKSKRKSKSNRSSSKKVIIHE